MKKLAILVLLILFSFVSCKRDEVAEPPVSGPSTLSYILEGWANPTTVIVSTPPSTSQVRVRLYDFTGRPISGSPIFFETLWKYTLVKETYDKYGTLTNRETENGGGRADLGNFYGYSAYRAYTDSNGYVDIIYTGPTAEEYNSRVVWSYSYGPPDNKLTDIYMLYINSFYIRARWVSPPSQNMFIYCDIPISLE